MNLDLKQMTLHQKIGQLIMFGFDALTLNEHAIRLIKEYQVGNVILFTRNIKTPEQVFALTRALQKLAMETIGVPLLIAIDQEGGMVTRIRSHATFFPGAMTVAATGRPQDAEKLGYMMGSELRALGINMNLAPVFDVNNNPNNPVIGVRSYSDDSQTVAHFATAATHGLQKNVLATAKHFPGHGDTHVDSHLALPVVNWDEARLQAVELYPFKQAIEAGIKAIMSSHVSFPSLDSSGLPSTLSKPILTDLLRHKMGFEGLIITDCMQMKAIRNAFTTPEATYLSIMAGADMVCISHSEVFQTEAVKLLQARADSGDLPEAVLDARVANILRIKASLPAYNEPQDYATVRLHVENPENRAFSERVVRDAVTLVKGKPIVLNPNALLIQMAPQATSFADDTDGEANIEMSLKHAFPKLKVITLKPDFKEDALNRVYKQAQTHPQVIVCSYNANIYPNQIKLIETLIDQGADVHVMAMRNPYDLFHTDKIKQYVCFYEYTPYAVNALIAYLKGDLIPSGELPIHHV